MALVTRYFDVSGAGAEDGTDYANRAPLIVSGAFNSIITGFDFTGTDALECILQPGEYSGLTTNPTFANAPTTTNRLFIRTADFVPPNWISPQPVWDRSGMARIQTTAVLGRANISWYGICFEGTVNAGLFANVVQHFDWCICENSASHANAGVISSAAASFYFNCCLRCLGTIYNAVAGMANMALFNCRVEGNPDATSGNRHGISTGSASPSTIYRTTVCNNVGAAMQSTGATGNFSCTCRDSTLVNNTERGVYVASSNTTVASRVDNSFIVGGGDGIDVRLASNSRFMGNRIRVSGTPIVNQIDTPSTYNDTSAGSDADEFVDAANGDFRIKRSSIYWGKGIGAGDEPAPRSYGFTY